MLLILPSVISFPSSFSKSLFSLRLAAPSRSCMSLRIRPLPREEFSSFIRYHTALSLCLTWILSNYVQDTRRADRTALIRRDSTSWRWRRSRRRAETICLGVIINGKLHFICDLKMELEGSVASTAFQMASMANLAQNHTRRGISATSYHDRSHYDFKPQHNTTHHRKLASKIVKYIRAGNG